MTSKSFDLVSYDTATIDVISVNVTRSGHVVCISGYIFTKATITANTKCIHIHQNLNPSVKIYFLINSTTGYGVLDTTGYIKFDNDLPKGYYFFNFSYII